MRNLILSIAAVMVASNAVAAPVEERALTAAEKAAISVIVADQLIDPDSAKIRWAKVKDDTYYCGMINGKNRMGGYAGFTPFIINLKPVTAAWGVKSFNADKPYGLSRLGLEWYSNCRDAGYGLDMSEYQP